VARSLVTWVLGLSLGTTPLACSVTDDSAGQSESLRGLSKKEALDDLDQIAHAVNEDYALVDYKEQRFDFSLEGALAEARIEIKNGANEADFVRPLVKLLARFHDGHVSFQYPLRGDASTEYALLFSLTPLGKGHDEYVVTSSGDPSIELGSMLVSVDGRSSRELEADLAPFVAAGHPGERKASHRVLHALAVLLPADSAPAAGRERAGCLAPPQRRRAENRAAVGGVPGWTSTWPLGA